MLIKTVDLYVCTEGRVELFKLIIGKRHCHRHKEMVHTTLRLIGLIIKLSQLMGFHFQPNQILQLKKLRQLVKLHSSYGTHKLPGNLYTWQ